MKPMLACKTFNPETATYPLLASYKLDGVRALVKDGVVYSRTLKPIPNPYVQLLFGRFHGFDGELCVGPINAPDLMQRTMSGVMSRTGEPDVTFQVFDHWDRGNEPFPDLFDRYQRYACDVIVPRYVEVVRQFRVDSALELTEFEQQAIEEGFEGVIVRDPLAGYKFGRSTSKDRALAKVKRFETDEATIVGFEAMMRNMNAQEVNELGRLERSTHKENLVPLDTLGAILLERPDGVRFAVGSGPGLTQALRKSLWERRESLYGATVTYKHFAVTGVKDRPRQPLFVALRDPEDVEISEEEEG